MNSYVEIAFLINLLCCICSYYLSCFFSYSKNILYLIFILFGIEQILHVIIFNPLYYCLFYIYEGLFYMYMFMKNGKRCIVYISIKYLLLFSFFKFYGGSFHLFHYYPNIYSNVSYSCLLLLICIFMLKNKWNHYLKMSDFIYDVYFYCHRPFQIKGFLDTGNHACIQDVPVIFIDSSYKDHFISLPKCTFNMNTINSHKEMKAYLCYVHIKGYKKDMYFICCDEIVDLEFHCKCLLNMEG